MANTRPDELERAGVPVTEEGLKYGIPSSAALSMKGLTPGASANSLLAGGMDEPEVDPRRARQGLALIARAFREIGVLKIDVGKLKQ